MTEEEWQRSDNPEVMIASLRGAFSDRKARLYACAACRKIWPSLSDERSREAVAIAELYADGVAELSELNVANAVAHESVNTERDDWIDRIHYTTVLASAQSISIDGVAMHATGGDGTSMTLFADLLRDIFGSPFRQVTFDPSWRTSTAVAIAKGMYDSREFSAMPILADVLQDAGCEHADILDHCRGPGPHVKGCWVVDLVLGKE